MLEKLNPKRTLVPLAAAAITALGVGGIAIAQSSGTPTPSGPQATQGEHSEAAEPAGDKQDREQQLTGPDATRAKQAALAKVGSGKVTDVSSEKTDANEPKDSGDAKDPGEQADPAYESKIAYTVEVTKADGSVVDVALDSQFSVLGTETDTEQAGEQTGEQTGKDSDGPGGHADEAPATGSASSQ